MDTAACSSNWLHNSSADDLQKLLSAALGDTSTVRLQKPADAGAGPCTISLDLQQPLLPAPSHKLLMSSNARMVEVSVRRPGDATPSYLQTVRCQPQGDCFVGSIDLQGAVGCTSLQLKLLSLQGNKSTCTIHQLHLQQDQPGPSASQPATSTADGTQQQAGAGADAATAPGSGAFEPNPAAGPVPSNQQAVSQMDELRLLLQQLHTPGGAAPVPESLQLLHSKATEAPQPGAGTAIKNLSAHIAQGMLFQAAQQRAQQQQQQQLQHAQQQDQQQAPPQDGGPASAPAPAAVGSAVSPSSAADREAVGLGGVLLILQRLEAKVDGIAAGLQQLDQRLARLEGSTGRQP